MQFSYRQLSSIAKYERKQAALSVIIKNVCHLVIVGTIGKDDDQTYYASDKGDLSGEEALIMLLIILGLKRKEIESMNVRERLTYVYLFGGK